MIHNVNSTFVLIYMILVTIFYVVAVSISYLAYREFKYMLQTDPGNRDGGER